MFFFSLFLECAWARGLNLESTYCRFPLLISSCVKESPDHSLLSPLPLFVREPNCVSVARLICKEALGVSGSEKWMWRLQNVSLSPRNDGENNDIEFYWRKKRSMNKTQIMQWKSKRKSKLITTNSQLIQTMETMMMYFYDRLINK